MIRLEVIGNPVTQGNKSAFVRGGRAVMVEGKGPGRQKHKDWRHAVAEAARSWCGEHDNPPLITGPVIVRMTFGLQKPASAPKRTRTWPIKARSGDIDKLARSVLDSLTGVLIADDSQAVAIVPVKDWSDPPGVVIEVVQVSADGTGWGIELYAAHLPNSREPFETYGSEVA